MVTIDNDELKQLLDDDIRAQYQSVVSIAVTKWVADTQRAMLEGEFPSLKRGFNVALSEVVKKMSADEARLAKRCCGKGNCRVELNQDLAGGPKINIL